MIKSIVLPTALGLLAALTIGLQSQAHHNEVEQLKVQAQTAQKQAVEQAVNALINRNTTLEISREGNVLTEKVPFGSNIHIIEPEGIKVDVRLVDTAVSFVAQ